MSRKYRGRYRENCETCGRFCPAENVLVAEDTYWGGFEIFEALCARCKSTPSHAPRSPQVWCNPPYSNIRPWVEKAYLEILHPVACAPALIVMLLPANRVEQSWWQELIEPYRDGRSHFDLRVEFLRGRMRFERPNAVIGPKGDRPPFGCCLVIWGA